MNRIGTIAMVVAFVAITSLTGCVREVIVRNRPPVERVEVIEVRPSPQHVWIAGHWAWEGEWVWVKGHWEAPPRERAVWVPGHWADRPNGWVWVEGHWRD